MWVTKDGLVRKAMMEIKESVDVKGKKENPVIKELQEEKGNRDQQVKLVIKV